MGLFSPSAKGQALSISRNLFSIKNRAISKETYDAISSHGWTYEEWAFFYAAKPFCGGSIGDSELHYLARASRGDFRDYLFLVLIKINSEFRKSIFLYPEKFHSGLVSIAEAVLEVVPGEFKADDWLASRLSIGVEAFVRMNSMGGRLTT